MYYNNYNRGFEFKLWHLVVLFVVGIPLTCVGCSSALGVNGFGPVRSVTATVVSKHVDVGKETGSSYMVTTDRGTYEVQNGVILGMWNADTTYGRLQIGKTYNLTVKGNEVVTFYMQQYPYVLKAEEAK